MENRVNFRLQDIHDTTTLWNCSLLESNGKYGAMYVLYHSMDKITYISKNTGLGNEMEKWVKKLNLLSNNNFGLTLQPVSTFTMMKAFHIQKIITNASLKSNTVVQEYSLSIPYGNNYIFAGKLIAEMEWLNTNNNEKYFVDHFYLYKTENDYVLYQTKKFQNEDLISRVITGIGKIMTEINKMDITKPLYEFLIKNNAYNLA